LRSSFSFNGDSRPFRVPGWSVWGSQEWSPSYDGCSTSGPFLHTPVPGLPEALLGNRFAADRGCGPCLGLGCPDLLQSYREFCLLGSMGLLTPDTGLLVKELIQRGQVGSHLV